MGGQKDDQGQLAWMQFITKVRSGTSLSAPESGGTKKGGAAGKGGDFLSSL